jgi:hypothetical protein
MRAALRRDHAPREVDRHTAGGFTSAVIPRGSAAHARARAAAPRGSACLAAAGAQGTRSRTLVSISFRCLPISSSRIGCFSRSS